MKKIYAQLLFLFVALAFSNNVFGQYCIPTYKGTGYAGSGKATPFFTHILEVHLGDLHNIIAAPTATLIPTYDTFLSVSTDLVRAYSYPMTVKLGNGANDQYVIVWIDWNQNQVFETSEQVLAKYDKMNTGNHTISVTVKVPSNAALGTTRMRVGTKYGSSAPDPCTNNKTSGTSLDWAQNFQDYTINILQPDVQYYVSSTSSHPTFDELTQGSTGNQLLQIVVENNTNGTIQPQSAGDFKFSLIGTSNPADITSAKLYYTGKDQNFSSATQVGSAVTNPSTYFTIKAGQSLAPGKNYFWLTYDISSTAIFGNEVDARINTIDVAGTRVPTVSSPVGVRKVGYCIPHGVKNNFVFVYSVVIGGLSKYVYAADTNGYGDYTKLSTTLYKNKKYKLSVGNGNGYNPNYARTWIDWNRDGDFNDAGELVLFDSINASTTSFSVGPVSDTVLVPKTSTVGPTRMRVIASYKPSPYVNIPITPCTNPVDIGEVEDYTINIADSGEGVADFSSSIVCLGTATTFKDASYTFGKYKVNSWLWNFGDGDTSTQQNPTHKYKTSGIFTTTLTVNTNKPGTASVVKKAVTVNEPKPDFSSYGTVYKTPIQFADQSTGGRVINWFWDFGDPQSNASNFSLLETPIHQFDTVGTYVVTLKITVDGGCVDSIKKTIKIVQAITPVANFISKTYIPYAFAPAVNLYDFSSNKPTSWLWTFSPNKVTFYKGTNDKSQNPVVTFDSMTTYKVTLTATNVAGSDTQSKFFFPKGYTKPVADFSSDKTVLKAGQVVSFLDLSKNDPIYWNWKMGNGDSVQTQHPIYKYKNTGIYDVTINAINLAGTDAKTKYKYITVTNNYKMCESNAPNSTVFSGTIADDGDSSNYTNNNTCGFLIKPDCSGPITLSFDSFFLYPNDFIRIYDGIDNTGKQLFSGAGLSGKGLPKNVVADSSGAMFIEEITDRFYTAQGFRATWSAVPNLKPKPDFKTYDSVGYVGSPCDFVNTTSSGITNTYSWDFDGDGILDAINIKNPTFTYTKTGTYKVKMIAGNCKGKDSIVKTVRVINSLKKPTVNFAISADTISLYDTLSLFDKSIGGVTSWAWSFDPDSAFYISGASTSRNPVVSFYAIGTYDITLHATNSKGTDSLKKKHVVFVKDEQSLCNAFISDKPFGKLYDEGGKDKDYNDYKSCGFVIQPCGQAVVLKFNYFDLSNGDWIYIYDGANNKGKKLDSFTSSSLQKAYVYTAYSGAMYVEQRNAADGIVGMGFDADWYAVSYATPKASYLAKDTAFVNSPHRFEGTTTGIVEHWFWDFDGDGITDDTTKNAKFIYTKTGTYKARLIVNRCISYDTVYKTILVLNPSSNPKANFIADLLTADISDTVSFKDLSGQGPTSWLWDINPKTYNYASGSDSTMQDPRVNFTAGGFYAVKLTATNSFGDDSITKTKYIHVLNYCIPAITTKGSSVGISRVNLVTIDNKSTISIAGYTDYSQTVSTSLEQRGKYGITIERLKKLDSVQWKVWIDYNQDGDFTDPGEMVAKSPRLFATTWSDSFKVPASALLGSTRMRIGAGLPSDPNTSCGPNSKGEYEDYRIIFTKDFTPPIIKVIGANPASVEVGYAYTDSGARAYDNIEGDVSKRITMTTNVDTGKVGSYQVKYNVKDSSGNAAVEVIRTVNVTADKTPPVLNLNGANPQTVGVFTAYTELGATAIDNRDGNVSSNIGIDTSEVKVNIVGSYNVYYTAADKSKNFCAQVARIVDVVDTTKPIILLNTKDTIAVQINSAWADPTTVKDNYYPSVSLTKTGAVNLAKAGTYTVTYDATDNSGNKAKTRKRVVLVSLTGIEKTITMMDVKIYPVPAKENINIHISLPQREQIYVELINPIGEVLMAKPSIVNNEEEFTFPVGQLPSGIYFIKLKAGSSTNVYKVQVMR